MGAVRMNPILYCWYDQHPEAPFWPTLPYQLPLGADFYSEYPFSAAECNLPKLSTAPAGLPANTLWRWGSQAQLHPYWFRSPERGSSISVLKAQPWLLHRKPALQPHPDLLPSRRFHWRGQAEVLLQWGMSQPGAFPRKPQGNIFIFGLNTF